jgi:hypothetical protein
MMAWNHTMEKQKTGGMALLWTEIRRYYTVAEYRKWLSLRLAYVVLQAADLLMTWFAVQAGYEELNPIVRGFLATPLQLVMFKFVVPLAIAWLVPARLLLPALVLLMAVIGFNITELFLLFFA